MRTPLTEWEHYQYLLYVEERLFAAGYKVVCFVNIN